MLFRSYLEAEVDVLEQEEENLPDTVKDTLIAIGTHARKICEGADGGNLQTAYYEKKEDFYQDKDRFIENGDIILVKGSRGMKMEQVVENILKQ